MKLLIDFVVGFVFLGIAQWLFERLNLRASLDNVVGTLLAIFLILAVGHFISEGLFYGKL